MIKNFIYLDERKLYSFSSQLFEGVTEYVLREEELEKQDTEESKEGITSSRMIADAIRETSKSTEKKFLHDHSFNLFEKELEKQSKILDINAQSNTDEILAALDDYSFIKIKSTILMSDVDEIVNILSNFNEIGENLEVITMQTELEIIEAKHTKTNIKDKDKAIESEFYKTYNIKQQALDKGTRQPKIWQSALTNMIELNAFNALQFHQQMHDILFSSYIEKSYLREELTSIKRKYSRLTEKQFTILGLICHGPNVKDKQEHPLNKISEDIVDMKSRLRAMATSMVAVEDFSYGREENEVIIEPIAIYTEL